MSLLKFVKLSERPVQDVCAEYLQQITAISDPV